MERLGDDELGFLFQRIHNPEDRKSFIQVSKKFLKAACVHLLKLHMLVPDFLNDILPASPNVVSFECSKPLSNTHMILLAQSCPKLCHLKLRRSVQNSDSEEDFDDVGLCAVVNACCHLFEVILSRRLHVGDVGVSSLVRSSKTLAHLDLSGCVIVTDESLKAIGEASCLNVLILEGCCLITDLGLKYLASGNVRKVLEKLVLSECERISDDGIICLKQMLHLTDLNLSKCGVNVTDWGVMSVSPFINVEILDLSWLMNITDMALIEIGSRCWELREIYLTGCKAVTGEGIRAFAYHRKLEEVHLFWCENLCWEDVELVVDTCERLKYVGMSRKVKVPKSIENSFNVINNCWIDRK